MAEACGLHVVDHAHFQDVLTPAATRSLMLLKGMKTAVVAQDAKIPERDLKAWLDGSQPMLAVASMKRLQAVMGTEQGRLSPKHRHFLDVDPGRAQKKALQAISVLFPGGQIHQIVGPSGKISTGKLGIYVVVRPVENAWLMLKHRKRWMDSSIDTKILVGMHWARITQERSRIPVGKEMCEQLEKNTVDESTLDAVFGVVARNMGAKSWTPPFS